MLADYRDQWYANYPTGCNTVRNDTMLMQVSSAHQMTVGEHLINWLNSLDTSEMTVQQLRKAMNEKFMKLGRTYYAIQS